jgi:hypothetical protein
MNADGEGMKRVIRILSRTTMVLSLLLCAASAIMWIRSYSRWDAVDWYRGSRVFQLRSAQGLLAFQRRELDGGPIFWKLGFWTQRKPAPVVWDSAKYSDVLGIVTDEMFFWDRFSWEGEAVFNVAGFAAYRAEGLKIGNELIIPPQPGCWALETPYWFWVVITAILPLHRARRSLWRRRRVRLGLCAKCGYDLRASFNRCPECGLATPCKTEPL